MSYACAALMFVVAWPRLAGASDPLPAKSGSQSAQSAVPSPESYLGGSFGSKAVRYDALMRYLEALAEASPRVTLTRYARSYEGRDLCYLTITSEANHARLSRIKDDNARLADPRTLGDDPIAAGAEAERIMETLPGIAWMAYSIHGDELASTDAAMHLAYELAVGGTVHGLEGRATRDAHGLEGRATQDDAHGLEGRATQDDAHGLEGRATHDGTHGLEDRATLRLLDELVIHIDPLMNPDGRERYLGQLEQLQGATPNPDYQSMQHAGLWSAGRGNHYLFDMNRDWLMLTQPETRGRVVAIGHWRPHLLVDSHEMGGLETYLFDPPRQPINPLLPDHTLNWRRRFGADQAKVFDARGWSYYTQEWYEEWYPGYTNAWASLNGGIGLLYEAAGVDTTLVRQPAGNTLTYPQTVTQHLISSLANLETLRANRAAILRDFYEFHRRALADTPDNQGAFVISGDAAPSALRRLEDVLSCHGIEYAVSKLPVEVSKAVSRDGRGRDALTLPAGTLVIRERQPSNLWVHAMLDFDPRMTDAFVREERERTENDEDTMLYDVTAWNVGMAFNLPVYWVDVAPTLQSAVSHSGRGDRGREFERGAHAPDLKTSSYGYLLRGADVRVLSVVGELLAGGLKPRVALDPFTLEGVSYGPGTILLRRAENPEDTSARLEEALRDRHVEALAVGTGLSDGGPDLGGGRFVLLHEPRVAIASQWPVSTTSFGAIWHLLDARVGLRTSPLNVQHISGIDLRKYNVLILPDASPDGLAAVLGDEGVSQLKDWISSGGTLIATSGAAAFVADASRKLSEVRLKRDVLDKLDEYAEALARERSARDVKIDPADVWQRRNSPPMEVAAARLSTEPRASARAESPSRTDASGAAPAPPSGSPAPASGTSAPPSVTLASPTNAAAQPPASAMPPPGSDAASAKPPAADDDQKKPWPDDLDERKRLDGWQRRFSPSGVFVAGEINTKHWLTFGVDGGEESILPVLVSGDVALMSKHPIETPVRLAPADGLRLAGLLWPEARQRLADTAWVTVERVGRGQIILFNGEPAFRGATEATARLLLNAVLLGPGAGTDQPTPW